MRVPTADYSPIEQANRARSNAIRAGFVAADASNWESRHENARQQIALKEQSLKLQEKGIELNEWNNTVNTILNVASLGLSAAENIYNLQLNKQKQQLQIALQDADNSYKAGLSKYGSQIRIEHGENGEMNVVKPQELIDLEKAIQEAFSGNKWMKEIEGTADAGLRNVFASNELQFIENAATQDRQAMVAMFNENWNTNMQMDISSGEDSPSTVFKLIDNRTDLSSAQKDALKLQATNEFKVAKQTDDAIRTLRREGLDKSLSFIDSLDIPENNKLDMRTAVYTANQNLGKEATAIGSSIANRVMESGNILPSDVQEAYDSIDRDYSDENGYSQDFRRALRSSLKSQHAESLLTAAQGWINEAYNEGTWSAVQDLRKSIENGALSGYFINQPELKQKAIDTLVENQQKIDALAGKNASDATKAQVYNLEWQYQNGKISWDGFVDGISAMQEQFGSDADMSKFFSETLTSMYKKRNDAVDPIAKQAFDIIKTAIGATDTKKLTEEERSQLFTLQLDVYRNVGAMIDANAEGIDSAQFKEAVTQYISQYTADYFDLLKKDPKKVTVFTSEGENAIEIIQEVLPSAMQDTGKDSGIQEIVYTDTNVQKKAEDAAQALIDKYNAEEDLGIVGYSGFKDKMGNAYIGFRTQDSSEYLFFSIEAGKNIGRGTSPDNLESDESNKEKSLKDMIVFRMDDPKNQAIDYEQTNWEEIARKYTLDEINEAIKKDKSLQPWQINIERKVKEAKRQRGISDGRNNREKHKRT